jgi:hypothetical protein
MDRRTLEMLYDLRRWMLRPDYQRLADAHHIRRDPNTYEISWAPSSIEARLHEAGLL